MKNGGPDDSDKIIESPSDGGDARGVRLSTWKQDINLEEIIL